MQTITMTNKKLINIYIRMLIFGIFDYFISTSIDCLD